MCCDFSFTAASADGRRGLGIKLWSLLTEGAGQETLVRDVAADDWSVGYFTGRHIEELFVPTQFQNRGLFGCHVSEAYQGVEGRVEITWSGGTIPEGVNEASDLGGTWTVAVFGLVLEDDQSGRRYEMGDATWPGLESQSADSAYSQDGGEFEGSRPDARCLTPD